MKTIAEKAKLSPAQTMTPEQAKQLATEAYNASPHKTDLDGVNIFCMFIGYPRSGHSLIGSLIDAHPNMIIAQELDALKYVKAGFNKEQIFYLLLENSQRFTEAGRNWNGYKYKVPNQWHGRFKQLKVIGDKKGGRSSIAFHRDPELFDRLKQTIPIKIKTIHITRNPFDNISTMSKTHAPGLKEAIGMYFAMAQTISRVKGLIQSEDFFEIRHEDFIEKPQESIRKLFGFLGEETADDFVNDCTSIIYTSPHKSRLESVWTDEFKSAVYEEIKKFPFLTGYKFED